MEIMLHISKPMHQRRNKKIRKHLEQNENESTTYQNLRDKAKVVLRGRSLHLKTFIRKVERYTTNKTFNLSYKKENFNQSKQKERQ